MKFNEIVKKCNEMLHTNWNSGFFPHSHISRIRLIWLFLSFCTVWNATSAYLLKNPESPSIAFSKTDSSIWCMSRKHLSTGSLVTKSRTWNFLDFDGAICHMASRATFFTKPAVLSLYLGSASLSFLTFSLRFKFTSLYFLFLTSTCTESSTTFSSTVFATVHSATFLTWTDHSQNWIQRNCVVTWH